MEKVVLDTNVVVSALIGKGSPKRILELVFEGKVALFLSSSILKEYAEVLNRPKFSKYSDFHIMAVDTVRLLKVMATVVEPRSRLEVCSDREDNKFLELAVEAEANSLVTGNKKHFPARRFGNIQIVSPSEFLRLRKGGRE